MSSLKFRFKKIDETRKHLLDEIKNNDLMSEKYKKTCKNLNYVEPQLILASIATSCVSISVFALSVGVPIGATSCVAGLKMYAVKAGIKKYKLIIKKKKLKKHDKNSVFKKS